MNKKSVFLAILVIAMLIPTTTVLADYAAISGELRDSSTNALWTHGASVEVFNCNTLATTCQDTVGSSGLLHNYYP